MKHPYNGILKTLEEVQGQLLQICVYQDLLDKYGAVLIMDEDPDGWLIKLSGLARFVHKKNLMLPLIINRRFIKYSLDSYPLEFINIVSSTRENILLKEDMLANLQFDKADVRLQMERELKSKWLLTRQIILESNMKTRQLRESLNLSIASLVPCLKGFFFLVGQPYPKTLADLFEHAALITKTDIKVMHGWMQEKNIELADVERYLSLLSRLMELMETYPVEQ